MNVEKVARPNVTVNPLRRDGAARGFEDAFFARKERGFEGRARGNRRERRGDADDRAVEIIKSFLLNARGDLRADATGLDGFMSDDQPAGFLDRVDDGSDIERRDAARIDYFRGDSLPRQLLCRGERRRDHARQGNNG